MEPAAATKMRERLAQVQNALGEGKIVVTHDKLVAHWEREIAAGRTPDLSLMPEDIPDE